LRGLTHGLSQGLYLVQGVPDVEVTVGVRRAVVQAERLPGRRVPQRLVHPLLRPPCLPGFKVRLRVRVKG